MGRNTLIYDRGYRKLCITALKPFRNLPAMESYNNTLELYRQAFKTGRFSLIY